MTLPLWSDSLVYMPSVSRRWKSEYLDAGLSAMALHSPEPMTRDTANSRIKGDLKVLFIFSGYIVP